MDLTVIITAGGIGKRVGAKVPKQFLLIHGKPVLQHTIESFYDANSNAQIIVTLPEDWLEYWQEMCVKYNFTLSHQLLPGGIERYDSIKKALSIAQGQIVLVHDGVRPLVTKSVIDRVINQVEDDNGVVPVVPLKSSIRKGSKEQNAAMKRDLFWEVQTPQGFMLKTLIKAYELPFTDDITDDASLVEKSGKNIQLVEGDDHNIKITTPLDLLVAGKILES